MEIHVKIQRMSLGPIDRGGILDVLAWIVDCILYLSFFLPLIIGLTLGGTCAVLDEGGAHGCYFGSLGDTIGATVYGYFVILAFGGYEILFPSLFVGALFSSFVRIQQYRARVYPRWFLASSAPGLFAYYVFYIITLLLSEESFRPAFLLLLALALAPWFLIELILYYRTRVLVKYRAFLFALAVLLELAGLFW